MNIIKSIFISEQPFRWLGKSLRNLFFPLAVEKIIPHELYIEIINSCNAKCIFCAYRFNYRAKDKMNIEQFRSIIASAKRLGYKKINLTPLTGELFLHPKAVEFIQVVKNSGFDQIETYTNGIVLHEHDIKMLVTESGLKSLKISFPGFSKEAYKLVFGVNRYEEFKSSITKLLQIHKKYNSSMEIVFEPRSGLTLNEIYKSEFYQSVIEKYISASVYFVDPVIRYDTWGGEIKQSDFKNLNMKIEINPLKYIPYIKKPYLCDKLLDFGILVNGDVRLCNCRYNKTIVEDGDPLLIDNLSKYESFEELLEKNRDKIAKIRDEFSDGKIPSLCKSCTFYAPVKVGSIT